MFNLTFTPNHTPNNIYLSVRLRESNQITPEYIRYWWSREDSACMHACTHGTNECSLAAIKRNCFLLFFLFLKYETVRGLYIYIPSLIGIKYLGNFLRLEIDLAEHQPSKHGIFFVWQFLRKLAASYLCCVCVWVLWSDSPQSCACSL